MTLFPEDNPAISTLDRLNIERFCTHYYNAKELIGKRKFEEARSSYVELLSLLEDLKKAELGQLHLNIAHHSVKEIYEELHEQMESFPVSPHSFRLMMIFTVIVLLIGVSLIVTPRLSGLAVLGSQPAYIGPTEFHVTGLTIWNLDDFFTSDTVLTFLVTEDPLLDVQLDGSRVYILPKGPGTAHMTLIAAHRANPNVFVRVPVVLYIG